MTRYPVGEIELSPEQLHIGFNRVSWDGRDEDGDQPSNGVYFYKLEAGDFVETRKMVLVK